MYLDCVRCIYIYALVLQELSMEEAATIIEEEQVSVLLRVHDLISQLDLTAVSQNTNYIYHRFGYPIVAVTVATVVARLTNLVVVVGRQSR